MEPKFIFADSAGIPWRKSETADGVEVKSLGSADGMTMELYKFAPNANYPDHIHKGPEFVFLLEGSARQDGKWLTARWSTAAEAGTLERSFVSGDDGCVFLTVYAASTYV